MRRNLFIIVGIFLGVLALLVTGNIIIVGEKIAQVTHLWWTEYVFYALVLLLVCYYILFPIIRIHRAPQIPALNIQGEGDAEQLMAFGKTLSKHCAYLSDENTKLNEKQQMSVRKEHQQQLLQSLATHANDEVRLREIIQAELDLRFKGDKELGVLGVNGRIREWAKSVFMITAISQNRYFDSVSVMYLNLRMIYDIVLASGFRPSNRQLFRMYGSILTTALITYAVSEALTSTPSVAPFDFGDLDSTAEAAGDDVADIDPDDVDLSEQLSDSEGLSVYSILRRIKIPGVVVGAALDGTINALMTLRIGYITRTYLQQGAKALKGIQNKRTVKRQAMVEAMTNVPAVIVAGSGVVGARTSKFLVKLVQGNTMSFSLLKNWRNKLRSIW